MRLDHRIRKAAFTLVEVILAILIISAIITVLLYFYQRSVEVRKIVLDESDFLSVSRMFLEQVTGELRTARAVEDQFIGLEGTSNSITFVCTGIPPSPRWIVNTNETAVLPLLTDLKRVSYRLLAGTNTLEVRGIDRTEEMLTGSAFTTGTNSTEFVSESETNYFSEIETNLLETNDLDLVRQPLTTKLKFLQFRYWGGTNWLDEWNRLDLPTGVEITIGRDPVPIDTTTTTTTSEPGDEYVFEIFRRVVYLPNSIPPANRALLEEPADLF